jgi:uncharacterized protein (TIGR02285 family)
VIWRSLANVFLVLVVGSFSQPLHAEQLTWLTRDWPPAYISQGPQQGQGTFDLLTEDLIRELPQYQHKIKLTSLSAREQKMQLEQPYCFFGAIKTPEREKYLHYSDVAFLTHGVKLFMLTDSPLNLRLPAEQPVNLVDLMQQPDIVGITEKKRTYPSAVQKLIEKQRLALVDVNESSTSTLQILAQKRADYVIEFQDRIEYLAQKLPSKVQLRQREIQGENVIEPVYVACRKTAGADAQIVAINQALARLRPTALYQQHMLRWTSQSVKSQMQQTISNYPGFQQLAPSNNQ